MQIIDNKIILKRLDDSPESEAASIDTTVEVVQASQTKSYAPYMVAATAMLAASLGGLVWQQTVAPVPPPVAAAVVAAKPHVFDSVQLQAQAAFVYDPTTGETMYARNSESQLPLASLAKLMLALVATKTIPADTPIVISDASLAQDGDSGLEPGEHWKLSKLLDLTLVVSSNDGADAIARAAAPFIQASTTATDPIAKTVASMNLEAKTLGLVRSYFLNPTGLDVSSTQSGAYGSARDVAHLLGHIVREYPGLLDATAKDGVLVSSDQTEHSVKNTNQVLDKIPGLIGGKTGYTDLAQGNLAVAFDLGVGHPVIAVVLGSSYEGRFSDMQTLVSAAQKYAREATY